MKKLISIIFALTLSFSVFAQNDTLFVLKNGQIIFEYAVADIDSIIFYRTQQAPPSGEIATITVTQGNSITIADNGTFLVSGAVTSAEGTIIDNITAHLIYKIGSHYHRAVIATNDRGDNTFVGSGNRFLFHIDQTHKGLTEFLEMVLENYYPETPSPVVLEIEANVRNGGILTRASVVINFPQKIEPPMGNLLFFEDFGTTAVQIGTMWPSITEYTGFRTSGAGAGEIYYSSEGGLVSVRSNAVSNFPGASGGSNVMLAATGASFFINNIATCGARNLTLSFGSNQTSNTLSVEYRVAGSSQWHPIEYQKNTETWGLVSNLNITLPEGTNTFSLRFTAGFTQFGTRLDDIKIVTEDEIGSCESGTPLLGPNAFSWERIGVTPTPGMTRFGLSMSVGGTSPNFIIRVFPTASATTKLVMLNANDWADITTEEALKARIDGADGVANVEFPMVNADVNVYVGLLYDGNYYMFNATRIATAQTDAGTRNTVSGNFKGTANPVTISAVFLETFGNSAPIDGIRPSIAEYDGWDNGFPVMFWGNTDVRATATLMSAGFGSHVWFAGNSDRYLTISGINTEGVSDLRLSFDLAHNALTAPFPTANIMIITTKDLNTGVETLLTVPVINLGNRTNTFITISDITGIPTTSNLEITFQTTQISGNTMGIRLDNVRIDGVK